MATKDCRRVLCVAGLFVVGLFGGASADETASIASFRLRGGFDANPTLSEGAAGAAFAGFDAAFAAGTQNGDVTGGLVGEASRTQYLSGEIEPSERYKTALEIANKDDAGIGFRSTSSVESVRNYQLHAFDAAQRIRLQWNGASWHPFVTAEFRYGTLNETNAIFPFFLPEDLRFVRSTAIPGVSYKSGDLEIGASVNLSMTRYMETYDIFGFRRDNERVQPFLFARYETDKLSVFANISQLHGNWHDPVFSDISRTLFEISAKTKTEPVSLEFSARRFASETSFPISPLAVVTAFSSTLSWTMDERNSLALFARDFSTEYLDSPFTSRTLTYGMAYDRALADNLVFGLEVSRSRATPLAGEDVSATAAFVSLTSKFMAGNSGKQAALPPVELGSRPSQRTR